MKILMVSSETVPFSKSGGLADVVGALSTSYAKMGHEVKVFMPLYSFIDRNGFKKTLTFSLPMLGKNEKVAIYEKEVDGVIYAALSHPYFTERKGIYGDTSFTPYPDNCPRFIAFSKAAVLYLLASGFKADIVHCHDWTTALVHHYIHYFKAQTKTVFTIHNLGYQGVFPLLDSIVTSSVIPKEAIRGNTINMMAYALNCFDLITTVSPTYAKEILTQEFGEGLVDILKRRENDTYGILNGIDYSEWDPETDTLIPYNFSFKDLAGKKKNKEEIQKQFRLEVNENIPLFSIISRLADQKGFDSLLLEGEPCALETILEKNNCQIAIVGTGDSRYVTKLTFLMERYKNLSVRITFSNQLSHLLEAGSDFFLMPSKYEPCGLNQLYSLRYGTLPIVHSTGGLKDTIIDIENENGNGFSFQTLSKSEIERTVERAILFFSDKEKMRKAQKCAFSRDSSWTNSAKEYEKLYNNLLEK